MKEQILKPGEAGSRASYVRTDEETVSGSCLGYEGDLSAAAGLVRAGESGAAKYDENSVRAGKENSLKLAREIYAVILDKKGKDVVIIDISEQSSFADYFVNATALNVRMLDSLHGEIDRQIVGGAARRPEIPPRAGNSAELLDSAPASPQAVLRGIEGKASSGWILMDYGDVIVNLFLEEQRESYQIEKIWADGIFIDPINEI